MYDCLSGEVITYATSVLRSQVPFPGQINCFYELQIFVYNPMFYMLKKCVYISYIVQALFSLELDSVVYIRNEKSL